MASVFMKQFSFFVVCLLWFLAQPVCYGQEDGKGQDNAAGKLVRVPLPITSQVQKQLQRTMDRLIEKAPVISQPNQEPFKIVLEFDTAGGKTGRGSEFGACFELARYLGRLELGQVRTIAYIPGPKGYFDPAAEEKPGSALSGHAVLVAIATNEIVMHDDASIGEAGVDEEDGDDAIFGIYKSIARKRLTLDPNVVLSMVDKNAQLLRVVTNDGTEYTDPVGQAKLEQAGKAIETTTLCEAGQLAKFTSQQMLDYRLIRRRVSSKSDLARELNLAPNALEGDPTLGRKWDAVEIPLPEFITSESVLWVSRALDARSANLIILRIDSRDSDPDACLQLAQKLSEYDSNQVRTVTFVSREVRGPAALVALSCDHVLMAPGAEILGPSDRELDEVEVEDFEGLLKELARKRGMDYSVLLATLDPNLVINRYRNQSTGQLRLLSEAEHKEQADKDEWLFLGPLATEEGIDAELAEQLFLARGIAMDMDAVKNFYQLDQPPEVLKPTLTDRWVKKFAEFLGSPLVAPWLMLGAFFFLSTEMSAPGIGVPGFLGAICLLLFFWSQYFGGNAHWLEILMFVVGVVFILIEVFAIPGFGLFGIGGGIMVVLSIVLASQTFIIPKTNAEIARLPYSLLPLVGAGAGFGIALFTLRNVLPNTPFLRGMLLQPKSKDGLPDSMESDPEAIVDWDYLVGRQGETVTRLFPAGKARIAGEVFDVISDGRMIDKGTTVEVAEVTGNRVLVRPLDLE